jgi:hypothetical protein
MEGEAVEGLTGDPESVLLVRPVPPPRTSLAELLFAAHPVPVGSGREPGLGRTGVAVWELCDPAAGDEPPWAVVATRPRESSGVVELVGAAVVPGGAAEVLLRRLFADVAAALRPAGHPMLIACVPLAQAWAADLLVAAGFAAQPGVAGHSSRLAPRSEPAAGAAQPGQEASAGPREPALRDVMWFTLEL